MLHRRTEPESAAWNILEQPILFKSMGICVFSPAHESEMRGYLVYLLIVKYLSQLIRFKFSHGILDWKALWWNWGGGETFLEGSVDHIIYRVYTANRRSFIYCSLASLPRSSGTKSADSLRDSQSPAGSVQLV